MGAVILCLASALLCAEAEVKRPRILGVAHMALYVSDLAKARAFYKDFLGFEEPFALKRNDGADRIVFIKINERQYLELFAEDAGNDGRLNHISFYTDDARAMAAYLASRGIAVPEKIGQGRTGNTNFNIKDPHGHTVEIMQYEPDSWTSREQGKYMPATRVSTGLPHIGVLMEALEPALKFYRDVLGFEETWRGGGSPRQLSWVNMRVPDGTDYLEFMLYGQPPEPARRGVKNHVCLVTPDIAAAVADLEARPARKQYSQKIEITTGVNRKRQANLFDPDGTRVELMEPNTIDGKPVPSSTAPPPR